MEEKEGNDNEEGRKDKHFFKKHYVHIDEELKERSDKGRKEDRKESEKNLFEIRKNLSPLTF